MTKLCDECRVRKGTRKDGFCQQCFDSTKECRECHAVKSIFEFEKNQRTPKGAVNRRSECKECRKKTRTPLSAKKRREFQTKYPPPPIGDTFECPVCKRMFTVENNKLVNLDHDSETGEVRGYICGECNTGMGKMKDDISILARAIIWIKNVGKNSNIF